MNKVAVRCAELTKGYGDTQAVRGVHLELEEGSIMALLGHSGCGKTTLLRLIAGFETPDQGTVEVGGKIVSTPNNLISPEKRHVGIVFQDFALFPHLNVGDNIAFGLPGGPHRKERVEEMLSLVGLKGFQMRLPHELSGGEQQRVALARALAPGPAVILLDEPFSNLDADLRGRVRNEVKDILSRAGATVLFVTHDQEEALFMGDRVGVMNCGKLEQVDTPENIFHRPATPFVAQFIGIADFITGYVQSGVVATEFGNLPVNNGLTAEKKVKVMVRPDFIDIQPADDGDAVIVDRVFQGMHYLYRVQLPSGATVRSLQHHNRAYSKGTRVSIKMNPDHKAVYFPE